jgi:hypothetical protein
MDLGPQFTSFRGMLLGKGEPPESDEDIVGRLDPKVRRNDGLTSAQSPYGRHWTDHEDTAHRFAFDSNAGGYQTLPPAVRKIANTPGHPWGVVLEAHHGPSPIEKEIGERLGDPKLPVLPRHPLLRAREGGRRVASHRRVGGRSRHPGA